MEPLFLRPLQLPVDTTVIGAAVGLDAKSAVSPQLPLGAETVRGLQDAQQYAARIGPIEGIWQSCFQAWCFLASANSSRRTS